VKLVGDKQMQAIDQRLAAATPPSAADTPQPYASEQTRAVSRLERDAILSATDVPRSDFHSFCVGVWASESDDNFATYEISGSPSCDFLSEKLGDNTTILERRATGGWRIVFTGTGPKTTCRHAPGIPIVVAIDFEGCPGQY
jgi:broad specificity phosphatase PhoE